MLKLVSNEVEEFKCSADEGVEVPTIFGVVRMGKGQVDRISVNLERGVRKQKGVTWESYRTAALQKEIWSKSIRYIKNIRDAKGNVRDLVDDRDELLRIWDILPSVPASEVIAHIQGISSLDEDEEGNSGSVPDSDASEDSTRNLGERTSAPTADSTD
ncbi:MAG: hypothetical protein KOO60_11020 [Gemmatimonadales bacterium]|nr:hypothetical protein [Gemmatimonadales bacterium]